MALIRIAGDGSCCECGDMDGCECKKCSKLECRSRGGVVKLCGFREFEGFESTPPRFYLDKILGGSIVICDYHSPSGKGPCWDDTCNSPVGWSISGSAQWNCYPEELCAGADSTISARLEVIAVAPGSPGNVDITFQMGDEGGGQCAPLMPSYSGLLNSTLFITRTKDGGSSTTKVTRPTGTVLGFSLILAQGCSPVGDRPFTVCSGDGGEDCETVSFTPAESTGATVSGLEFCVPTRTGKRWSYSGKATILPTPECTESIVDSREQTSSGEVAGCNPPTSGGTVVSTTTAFEPEFAAYVTDDPLNSGSFKGQISNDACVTDSKATSCDRFEQLQSEDTDEDARARLLASPEGAWSAWQIVLDGTNGTCINPACCRAAWEIRTDQTYVYREAEWRATIQALTPGTHVTIKINVYRKTFGGPTYALLQTEEYDVTADGDGNAVATGTVVNDEGFETYVSCTYSEAA